MPFVAGVAGVLLAVVGVTTVMRPRLLTPQATSVAASVTAERTPPTRRQRLGGVDLTFIVASDTHVGFAASEAGVDGGLREPVSDPAESDRINLRQIRDMNSMSGRALPGELGGKVGVPRGVLISGDLTENGEPWQWRHFVKLYGLDGHDGELHFPVFEAYGNHDKHHSWYTLDRITERHGAPRYAFDWDDLRVVNLGEAPDDEALAFLSADLTRVGKERPVVIYFHFPLRGPWSDNNWFGEGRYRADLARVLFGYNVVGLFHGHYHASGRYQWEGVDVYNVGATKHEQWSFAVVHVTDTRFTVLSWNYRDQSWEFWHDKPINGDRAPEREGGARPDRGLYLGR